MQVVSTNGIVINYSDTGPRDGPCLVFSNSLGTDYRIWQGVAEQLSDNYRLVFYDKRGHGLSSAPQAPYAMKDHVDDLTGLLDHLEVKDAVIVGLSVGGLIALGLLDKRPDLVRALVLSDTAPKIGTHEMWSSRISAIRQGGLENAADDIMQRWFPSRMRKENPTEVALWRHMMSRTPVEGYLGTCEAIMHTDFTHVASALSVPSLCIVGSEDGATPVSLVTAMSETIPDSRLEIIDGAGHLPCIQYPDQIAALIEAFLTEHGLT
ncbi:MAG: 3-oxoadipate enol-lactonase [Stappiaceae bacterium]